MRGDKVLFSSQNEAEAKAKAKTLGETAAPVIQQIEKSIASEQNTVNASQRKLDIMEANGLFGTPEYNKASAKHTALVEESTKKVDDFNKTKEYLQSGIEVKPKKKAANVKAFTTKEKGVSEKTFATREEALQHALENLGVPRLNEIAAQTKSPGLKNRIKKEIERRKNPKPFLATKPEPKAPEAPKETPLVTAQKESIKSNLLPMLKRFGLGDVALQIEDGMKAEGSYTASTIKVALDAKNPVRVLRHESLHGLKDLGFFTDGQWKVLENQADSVWIKKYLKDRNINGEPLESGQQSRYDAYVDLYKGDMQAVREEAIADAFGDFDVNGAPKGVFTTLLNNMRKFFEALRNALNGAGYETSEDVFGKVERGELKATKEASETGKASVRALTPITLDTKVGRGVRSYFTEFVEPLREAVAKGNFKSISLKNGTKVNLVVGEDKADDTRGVAVALDQENKVVGSVTFYKNETEDGTRFNPDAIVQENLRRQGLATALYDLAEEYGALIPSVDQKGQPRTEDGKAFREARANAFKADKETIKAADKYEEENGIRPYVSEGFLDLPTDGIKYSLQKFNPEKHLAFDATLGLPINKNGLVTLYYHTTKDQAVKIGNKKVIPSEGRNRVYLTNESNGAGVLRQRGNFDQELDGSSVLVYVHPDMLQVDDTEYKDGRKDFYVPLAQGDYFNNKMKLQSIQKSRSSPITEVFSYTDHEEKITSAVKKYKDATPAERRKLVADSRKLLKQQHNIGSLLSENGKLEKTRLGDYDLDWEGNSVASMGLGLASAQQISEKVSTCPRSAICEGLCLGETSGGNFMFGGAASEDVGDIQKSSFRAAARMMQYLKTEALVINPEAFATVLQAEIDSLAKWSSSETQVKIDPETKKRTNVEKEIYQPAVRLNVTSDFKPTMFRAIIEENPDTMFYDYTKLGSETIAPNHHLTYSSTGFGQIVDGEKVFFKDKNGKYDHNWATMRDRRLNNGENVAMAFSSKSGIPEFLLDEETGVKYKVWNGDDYDARFLDPKQPDGKGMIIGLKNKAGTLSEKTATQKTGGFFVQYDPKTDGDTVVVPDQSQFKSDRKVIPIAKEDGEKLSLRTSFATPEAAEKAAYKKAPPETEAFKEFFGASTLVEEGRPRVMYHASPSEFNAFSENKPIFVSPDAKDAEYFSKLKQGKRNYVYPLWVRAETPFDFENPEHVSLIRQGLINNPLIGEEFAYSEDRLSSGDWPAIEDPSVQDEIKKFGFDSFYVMEGGTKNLAVYSAEQVKSVTGNIGEFSRESKDMRFSLRGAGLTPKRVDNLLNKYAYDMSPNDTKAYVGRVNPRDFLNATTTQEGLEIIRAETTELDDQKLISESQPIYLAVKEGTFAQTPAWEIKGHEGRHRMMALANAGYDSVPVVFEFGNRVKNAEPIKNKYVVRQKFNGGEKAIQDFSVKNVVPVSYANKAQLREFENAEGLKFSIRADVTGDIKKMSNGPAILAAINRTTQTRQEVGFIERITSALAPESFSYLRQKGLDRYNRLSDVEKLVAKKMGGIERLADSNAHSAALQSDLAAGVAASALGVGDRIGGIPKYEKGYTTVSNEGGTIKGAVAIFAPLARLGDPKIYQAYQFWAASKRGKRLLANGKEELFTPQDFAYAKQLEQKYPEFVSVQKDWIKYNDGLVKYAVDTGVISAQNAAEFVRYSDYLPFYRQLEGERTIGPNIFQSISGVKAPKKITGSEAPLADFLETIVRNTQATIQAGMKNVAAQKAAEAGVMIGMVKKLDYASSAPNTITILEKGKKVSYECADKLWVDAVSSLNLPELPFLSIFAKPADLLRNLVTKDPGFMLANLMRDSVSAYVTSGANITPLVSTMKEFTSVLMNNSPEYQKLLSAGALGGYEFSRDIESSTSEFAKDLRKKTGTKTTFEKATSPFTLFWNGLEKGTTASDAATRIAIYKATLKETGNEAEAIHRALEVMNFNRKGSSAVVRIAAATIPFLNARMQGLDVFFRSGIRPFFNKDATAMERQVQKAMIVRGSFILGMSAMYAAAIAGNPDYEAQEEETKDNNWIIPLGNGRAPLKIPIPFEVGTLFKTVPERIYRRFYGLDTNADTAKAVKRALVSTFGINPVPQVILPLAEAKANYSVFTQREIISGNMKDISPEFQVGPGTTKTAEFIGKQTGLSPIMIDHVYKGYTGTIGGYAADLLDASIAALSPEYSNQKASKRFTQMPIVKRFFADPDARGKVTAFYDLKNSVDSAVRTVNFLDKTNNEGISGFAEKNATLYASRDLVNSLNKQMQDLQDQASMVRTAPIPPDQKRDILLEISKAQNLLVNDIRAIRKIIQP
jgi:hypothetical protein